MTNEELAAVLRQAADALDGGQSLSLEVWRREDETTYSNYSPGAFYKLSSADLDTDDGLLTLAVSKQS